MLKNKKLLILIIVAVIIAAAVAVTLIFACGNGDNGGNDSNIVDFEVDEWIFNARYMFERIEMPEILFEAEDVVATFIEDGNVSGVENVVRTAWMMAVDRIVLASLGGQLDDAAIDALEEDYDALFALMEQRRNELRLGIDNIAEHILSVRIEELDADVNIAIVELRSLEISHLNSFLAIVDNQELGLLYFTLERGFEFDFMPDDTSINYFITVSKIRMQEDETLFMIENDLGMFISAIREFIADL
ncbi:MAG: hypothetical protein FWE04_06235 [Oscillospiraceae bacterium]|nr:hypothetical protein [Oscillospiraceae bacterium]